ncbi:MAG: hypothetical protein KDC61_18380 [Saprospiraceae bacterium]|nr:hypothetical protein [Saprospiraceae bacterium]MCB0576530.1 hypothetical protein [Saprospiraceae bacterium]MCB9354920.1 hypothetical protein [Lewinellaceae bacterium]
MQNRLLKGSRGPGILFVLILLLGNCAKESASSNYAEQADCTGIDAQANSYTNSIKAILDAQCATSGCHDAFSQSESIDLSNYASAKSAFENRACLCSIHHGAGCTPMPEGRAKLSDATIQKIDCWVKNGYQQ